MNRCYMVKMIVALVTHTQIHTHAHPHICMHAHTHTCNTYTCAYTHTHACIHIIKCTHTRDYVYGEFPIFYG